LVELAPLTPLDPFQLVSALSDAETSAVEVIQG